MADNKNIMKDKDFAAAVAERFGSDPSKAKLIPLVPEFLELLGTEHFTPTMEKSVKNGDNPVTFLNFWMIKWRKEKATRELVVNATCSTKTPGRKLTEHFVNAGNKVTPVMCDYLYSVVGHPGSFPQLVQTLSKRAKQKSTFYDHQLTVGKNLTLLFRMVLDTLLYETFDNGKLVQLSDLGSFEITYKIGRKNAPEDRPPGYFQFTPNFP